MPPPPVPEPEEPKPSRPSQSQYSNPSSEAAKDPEPDKASLNGDAYVTQWHNRRQDD
ncbi:hypothetical protein BGZ65_012280, partial [Modicella reniformis]